MCYIKFGICNNNLGLIMRKAVTKILVLLLMFVLCTSDAYAVRNVKMLADVDTEFTIKNQELPDEISFKTIKSKTIPNVITIPENSIITLEIIRAQRELRWHKGGLILCRLKNYVPETTDVPIDVSDKNIYLVVRKYEKINKKEAWILGTEIVVFQGASFFAPGVDIGYFFLKGAIQRQKHPHWFKAGVRNAYDNSIFWFPQKGKSIELADTDMVEIKDIKEKKVEKLITKIDKRKARFERQAAKRISKKEEKAFKRELKYEKKLVDCSVVEKAIEDVVVDRSVLAEIAEPKISDEN